MKGRKGSEGEKRVIWVSLVLGNPFSDPTTDWGVLGDLGNLNGPAEI